jgi:hypothetical protein
MNPGDQEIASALSRLGTVPGPALKEQNELAKPPIPRGPIPPLKMPSFGSGGGSRQPASPQASIPAPAPEPTVQAPRD